MQKVVTLRCPECGETCDFLVGAGTGLSSLRDAMERMDKKEAEKLSERLAKVAASKSKVAMKDFSRNAAEPLYNIAYDKCGEESISLLEGVTPENESEFIGEKAKESIVPSDEKWQAAVDREGTVAFDAIYICPKSRRPQQGLHVSVRWKDEKGNQTYVYANKCGDCSSALTLANDGNVGFMHEGCVTTARCAKCGKALTVDKVSFKIPQKEQTETKA